MEKQKRSFFSLRAHWALRISLVLILGAAVIFVIIQGSTYLFKEDRGIHSPSRSYAHQIRFELLYSISQALWPSELFRWRSTGKFEDEPIFLESTLFWFTYNSTLKNYEPRVIHQSIINSPDLLYECMPRFIPTIDSILAEENAGPLSVDIRDELGDHRLRGRIYKDEPIVVAMVTDMDLFRKIDLPRMFTTAELNSQILSGFSEGPEAGSGSSSIFVLARDRQDSIIAQIGIPGEYAYSKELGSNGYKIEVPYFDQFGFSMEVVIPVCMEKALLKMITRFFWLLVAIWIVTMIKWVRTEILLKKARSN